MVKRYESPFSRLMILYYESIGVYTSNPYWGKLQVSCENLPVSILVH